MKLWAKIPIDSSLYVVINMLVALVGFVRSFICIKTLGLYDLGLITLIMMISSGIFLLQFGLLPGGYRLVSLGNKKREIKTNDLMFSFFAVLTTVLLIAWLFSLRINLEFNHSYLLVAFLVGILMLISIWTRAVLVGRKEIKLLNKLNLYSSLIAFGCTPLVFLYDVLGAIIMYAAQPLLFLVLAFFLRRELLPKHFFLKFYFIKYLLTFGFIPFVAGLFVAINIQIERWSIKSFLSTEDLGKLYLVFLVSNVYVLVPQSLSAIFFPRALKSYKDGSYSLFRATVKKYAKVMLGYSVLSVVVIVFLLEPIVGWIFPKHLEYVKYVYFVLPGLIAYSLSDIVMLVLNAIIKLRPMIVAGVVSTILTIITLIVLIWINMYSLESATITKSVVNILFLFFYIIVFIKLLPFIRKE